MSGLESLYQELLLDHSRHPHGRGLAEGGSESHQLNPICGDEITLRVRLDEAGAIESLSWDGRGCVISQASASMLAGLLEEHEDGLMPAEEMLGLIARFREALRSRGTIEIDAEVFGDATALSGVSRYTARVKCAMLAWVAAEDAVRQARASD